MLNSDCPDSLLAMLEVCWAEDPHERLCLLLFTITIFFEKWFVTLEKTAFEEIEEELDKILVELQRQEKPGTVHMRPKNVEDMY